MTELLWQGKEKVKNHHKEVAFHLLQKEYEFHSEDRANSQDNLLIHGDNLLALKSLLPQFAGKVNCIYIDPPYNTGEESWVYNDNVNDPKIQKWLGEVVGKEGEDFSRHDKWLCMMFPRLKLLKELLAENGVIFISIDDNEQANLKLICDEIFGSKNFLCQIIVQSNKRGQTYKQISKTHEYLLCYQKTDLTEIGEFDTDGENLDKKDKWGSFSERELRNRNPKFGQFNRPNLFYPIYVNPSLRDDDGNYPIQPETAPNTIEVLPYNSKGEASCWRWGKDKLNKHIGSTKDIFAKQTRSGEWRIFEKYRKGTVKAKSLWLDTKYISEQGTTEFTKLELDKSFDFPKPIDLIKDCLILANNPNAIVLDSFSGSGTTAHAVLSLNKQDGGNRKFICIEMEDYAEQITAERIRRVIKGYGKKAETLNGTGGGFSFYKVAEPLFINEDELNPQAPITAIREYVGYTEGLSEIYNSNNPISPHALGYQNNTIYIFYYLEKQITTLDLTFLESIKLNNLRPQNWIIYADTLSLSEEQLKNLGIIFKKIPRDISKF